MKPFPALVPRPTKMTVSEGEFVLDEHTSLSGPETVTTLLRRFLAPATGIALPQGPGGIELRLVDDPSLGREGYRIRVAPSRVNVEGDELGLKWAVQTLRQLLPPEIYRDRYVERRWELPCLEIVDCPSHGWRGSLLDVARWYQPLDFLLRYVDLMAMHKLNRLHLHLTDDQGWRFEVRAHPRLTEIGSVRPSSQIGHVPVQFDGRSHGGFYPQEQLRKLVEYAARLGVEVMPEIDVPGHVQAAVAAYPLLGNDPRTEVGVRTRWGISTHILNLEPETVRFVLEVFDELVEVFPFEYIHTGGDEVPADEWRAHPRARALMAERALRRVEDLQGWWSGQVARRLTQHGRKAAFWDEAVDRGVPAGSLVFAWQNEDRIAAARAAGLDVVAAECASTYLDFAESPAPWEPAAAGLAHTPLERVYGYRPTDVVGMAGQVWTECLPTGALVEYRAYPRLAALAESAWSAARDFPAFRSRLAAHLSRLDQLGVRYRPLVDWTRERPS